MATYKLITDRLNTYFTNNKITVGTAAPTSGTHAAGDMVLSSSANSTAFGWICTAAGTPGTWKVLKSGGDVTSISGNAGTATKFASSQTVALTGDVTGSASSQAGWSVATTLANSGVTAGSYGPSAAASPAHGGTFSVPYITVDAKGRVTSASTKTITLPSSGNTDTKVTNTLATTTKAYVTGTTTASTNTGTQVFDTGVYLDTTAGQLTATTFKGALSGNASTATKFASAQSVALTGDVTGSASSQAGWSVAATLANSGVTAGSYGPSAAASPAHGGTFSVPYITVDAKGRVTSASTKTITLPSSGNTDTKVTYTLGTTTKFYMGGPTATATGTGGITFDTGIYATTTAGQLHVGSLETAGHITTTGNGTCDLGSTSNRFKGVIAGNVYSYGANATHYASLRLTTEGTADTQGVGRLVAGNNIAAGTAGNAKGQVLLYGTSTGYTTITPGYNSTSNITLTLPSSGGTLARTADNVTSATKVHTTLGTTTKAFLLGTSTTPTSTSTAVNTISDTGVYLTTTAGQLQVTGGLISGSTVRSDTAVTDNLGTSTVPWKYIYGQHHYINNDATGTNYGRFFVQTAGTTSAVGNGRITLGNSTASGTANNAQGSICLYGSNTGYTIINPGYNSTSSVTLTLPAKTGTLACTSDLSSYLPLSGGTMTGPIKRSSTTSWVNGMTNAFITSTASAGGFQPMMAGVTTNGSMVLAYYNNKLTVGYVTKANVDAGTNTVSETATLFDESGNATWSGVVTSSNIVTQGISLKGAAGNDTEAHPFVYYDDTDSDWFVPSNKPGFHVGDQGCGLYFCGSNISFCYFSDDTTISSLNDEDGVEAMCSPDDIGKRKPDAVYNIYHEGFNPTPEAVGALSTEGGTVTGETTFESVVTADTIYSTNAINISSDRNLKEDIKYISPSNANLLNEENTSDNISLKDMYDFVKDELGLASYTMKNDKESKKKINFIAQDLLYNNNNEDSKVGQLIVNAEHAVNNDTSLSYDLGNYNSIIAGALQYAIKEIENLKAEIEELKSK